MGIAPPTLDSILELNKQQFLDFFSDVQIYDSYVAQNAVGTEYAFLSYSFAQTFQGSTLTIYGNQVMFFVGTDIVTLTISADISLRELIDSQATIIFDTVSVLP